MTPETLEVLFGANFHSIQVNTNGITHHDSLVQPHPAGNCMNWVLGHIVWYRNTILTLLNMQPVWTEEDCSVYARGSKPLTDPARARPVAGILRDFIRSQEMLIEGLRSADREEFGRGDLAERISWLQFHEAYHAGQIGLLRRIAGKDGMIR